MKGTTDRINTRGRNQYLTEAEKQFIRDSFITRQRIEYVADKLNCSTRCVTKYYGFFRDEGVGQTPNPISALAKAGAV